MEGESSQNRKRARDGGEDTIESNEGKKQECMNKSIIYNDQEGYEFYDGIGVFDFPWLKEGVIFKGDDYYLDEHEEKFAPCPYLDEAPGTFAANLDQPCLQNFSVSPGLDGNSRDDELGDDSFWSLLVDDCEPVDCIWSCVIDQPLDIGFNRG